MRREFMKRRGVDCLAVSKVQKRKKEKKANNFYATHLPAAHISETFFPHLFLNIEMYLNFQQKLEN